MRNFENNDWQFLPCHECSGYKTCTLKFKRPQRDACGFFYAPDVSHDVIKTVTHYERIHPENQIWGYRLEGHNKHSYFGRGKSSRIRCVDCGIRVEGTKRCNHCQSLRPEPIYPEPTTYTYREDGSNELRVGHYRR